ncbi:hypothetical protein BC826DRAFT_1107983 [Russula brevipes]|nr:hypothetical protein BC826DRAFT_1107983 [Russula brevipes]
MANVRNINKAAEAVAATVALRSPAVDGVLVANTATLRPVFQCESFASANSTEWRDMLETNVRGTYIFVHFVIPELQKGKT